MTNRQTERITALYERLSRDDGILEESNSILNQKKMLEDYAKQNSFGNIRHYTDDGWSGGNFERPAWKQLISDIEAGRVGCVIAKDMSRIGREYLQTGFYTEVMFRQHGVRFIAISNGIDSNNKSSGEFAPFLNIMNEWYLRDCSRKQLAAYQLRGKAGKPTTCHSIYGYKKDPLDKHHWLIDEEAAAVVKRIYNLCVEGNGPYVIARILREDKVEKPSVYFAQRNMGNYCDTRDSGEWYNWSATTVINILKKPEYMGHTVNFRTYKENYKDKKRLTHPEDEWLIFENTHEAIIDKDTWELVQKLRSTVRRTDTLGVANPLTGIVFCADCGAKMYNQRGRRVNTVMRKDNVVRTNYYISDTYNCSSYKLSFSKDNKKCFSHNISTKALQTIVLDTIRAVSKNAIADKDAFAEKILSAANIKREETLKDARLKLNQLRKRRAELDKLIMRLYESYVSEKISESNFSMLMKEYESEQTTLEEEILRRDKEVSDIVEDTENVDQFIALAEKYTDFTELTAPLINEFIDKIIVHAADKSNGEREQEIEIYLKYIGKVELPEKELTPEELEKEEKARIRRAKNREAAYKYQKRMRSKIHEQQDQRADVSA